MAERRMFAKTIIDSDAFLDMPISSQNLYFHLSMRADDDGFINNPKKISRMIGSGDDDLKLLLAKRFIIGFDSGIIVIKHWRIHNYIQKDRYIKTKYAEEFSLLKIKDNGSYTLDDDGSPIQSVVEKPRVALEGARKKRYEAKMASDLPYSFEYKIRNAFVGKLCPICGCSMTFANTLVQPTIQHNKPISNGGKHEIDNISVICRRCNSSIQNRKDTPPYNTDLVKEIWSNIGNVSGMDTQVRLGKDSIGKEESASPFSRIESARTAWNNTPGLPQYRYMAMNIPPDKASPMLRTLSAYSDDDVLQSIKNYAKILSDPGYEVFPRYGSFQGFMSGGVELFHDDAKPFDRCRKNPEKQGYQKMGALDDRPDAWTSDDIRQMQEDTEQERAPVDLLGYIADSPLAAAIRGKQEVEK